MMKVFFNKFVLTCAVAALMISNVSQAQAGFAFSIDPISFTGNSGIGLELAGPSPDPNPPNTGSGYENGLNGGKLLGVVGNVVAATPVNFVLPSTVGASYSFAVATYRFDAAETHITQYEGNGGIYAGNPLHDIGFTLDLNFLDPIAGLTSLQLVGNAVVGNVADGVDEYILSFNTVTQSFGTNKSFSISIATLGLAPGHLGLSKNGETLTLEATITIESVPEPSSMALLGLGGIASAIAGYRRRRALSVVSV